MKTKDVLAALNKHSGPVYVAALIRDEIIYVKVVKSDLIEQVKGFKSDNLARVDVKSDGLYFDAAN